MGDGGVGDDVFGRAKSVVEKPVEDFACRLALAGKFITLLDLKSDLVFPDDHAIQTGSNRK